MIFSFVVRNLGRRPGRTVLGVLGILVTMCLLTGIHIALDSITVSYLDLVAIQAGKADIVISRQNSDPLSPQPFDYESAVAQATFINQLRGFSPRLLGLIQVQHTGAAYDAVLVGLDLDRERRFDISGISPMPDLPLGTCALSKSLAEKLKVKAGVQVLLSSPATYTEKRAGLKQILTRQQVLPQQVRDYVVVNLPDARELLGVSSGAHFLAGGLRAPGQFYRAGDLHGSVIRLKRVGAALATELGMEYDVRLPKAAALTAFQDFTSPLRAVFGVFVLLALTITGLLIYSLISVAVEERVREYGILRTVGAKRAHIWGLVLTESLLLCVMGVIPGVLFGALAAKLIIGLIGLVMSAGINAIALDLRPATMALTLLAGVLLAVGSAIVPAVQATRWRIVDALDPLRRGQIASQPAENGANTRPLILTGVALSGLSAVVFFILPSALFSGNPSLIGTVFLCLLVLMLLGLTLGTLGVLPWVQRCLLWVIGGLFAPAADLIDRNLARHRRRHTTTALLFSLSVSLVIFIASLVALASRTALSLVEHTNGADLRIYTPQAASDALTKELQGIDGVRSVSEARLLHSRTAYGTAYDVVLSDLVGMKQLWVVPYGVDERLPETLYTNQMDYAEGDASALAHLNDRIPIGASGSSNTPVILSLAVARALEVGAGDVLNISFRLGASRDDARLRVVAVCRTLPGFDNFRSRVAHAVGSGVLLPMKAFQEMTQSAPAEAFQALYFIRTTESPDAQKSVARKLRDRFDLRYRFAVKSTAEGKDEARAVYWATQVFFGILLAVEVTIAVFALIASMTTTILERSREIGVLKALGMKRSELFRLFLGESVTLTVSAGIAGGVIGFVLAWLFVVQATILMEIKATFTMPYLTLASVLVISTLAGMLAAFLPTRSLLRKTAAEILRG